MGVYLAIADTEVELADRVIETTQTTGTGTYSLDGVSSIGRQSFVGGVGSGNSTIYTCELDSAWEIGVGTVTAGAPDTLSRDFIIASSSGGSAISWASGVKTIFIDTVAALLLETLGPGKVLWDNLSGGNNATTITVPIITSYYDGMTVWFRKNSPANTTSMTLEVNGLGAKSLLKAAGIEIGPGEAAADSIIGAVYVASLDDFLVISGLTPKVLATPQTLTGTSVDYTVGSAARRITVLFGVGCSSNGTSPWLIRLGDAGGVEANDYASVVCSATASNTGTSTAGFRLQVTVTAADNYTGEVVLTRINPTTHVWQAKSTLDGVQNGTGVKTLSAAITTVRITTTNGTDSFDGGSATVIVEY